MSEELLARLLDEWRATYDEVLVEPIIQLGARLAKTRAPLRAKTQAALEAAWHAKAVKRDPADLDMLLAVKWPRQQNAVLARLDALSVMRPDPRIPPKLLELRGHWGNAFDVYISRVLARSPTQQLAILLEGHIQSRFGAARAALAKVVRTSCDPQLRAEALSVLEVPAERRMAALLADNPADDAARSVLADELQSAGDPRGEFIALQLAIARGTADEAANKRASKLLAANLDAWLRPFPNPVPDACRFERGFPVAIVSTARGKALDVAIERPEWATVEELTIDGRDADVERLLRRLPLLRTLSTRDETLADLAKRAPFRGVRSLGTPLSWFPETLDAFPDCVVLAGSWNEERHAHLQQSAAALGVQAIVYVRMHGIARTLSQLAIGPPVTRFTIATGKGRGWYVSLARDQRRARLAWAGGDKYSMTMVSSILAALAEAKVREITVCAEDAALGAVEYWLRQTRDRFADIELRFDGSRIDIAAPPDFAHDLW